MNKFVKSLIISFLFVLVAASFTACFGESSPKTAEYAITYHLNGGKPDDNWYYDVVDDDTVMVRIEQVVPPTGKYRPLGVERKTWFFGGWYTDPDCTEAFEILPADDTDVDLYAKWTDKITVTKENFKEYFTVNSRWNGSLTIPGAAVVYSFEPKYTIDPTRSEGTVNVTATPHLSSWRGQTRSVALNAENDFSFSSSAAINQEVQFYLYDSTLDYDVETESVDLYLLHEDPIDVTLELNGGTLESGVISVPGGDKLKKEDLPVPVKEGYRFMGWYADAQFQTAYGDTKITREISLYAKFTKEAVFTFDVRGGSEKERLVFLEGELLRFGDDPVKEDYGFAGWYTDSACTVEFTETRAGESHTLYARWEPYRTVTFDTKGGREKESATFLNGQTIDAEDLGEATHESGYLFDGWFTDSECTKKYGGGTVASDMTLYARWCVRYTKLSYQLNENFDKFFDTELTFKRENDKLITHVSIALKDQYKDFYFAIIFSVEGNYKGEDGTDYGNFMQKVTISTLNGKTSVEFEKELERQYTGYDKTDHIDLKYYHDWSEIRLPVDYVIE